MGTEITNEFIQELITCKKVVKKADRKNMIQENRSLRNNIQLTSADGKYEYVLFLRQSCEFLEDFSVGLKWVNPSRYFNINKSIILFRCQGPHDSKQPEGTDCHHDYHTHEITVKDINERRYEKPQNKEVCKEFSSFESAIYYFCKKCGINNLEEYINIDFSEGEQMSFI